MLPLDRKQIIWETAGVERVLCHWDTQSKLAIIFYVSNVSGKTEMKAEELRVL